MARLTAVSGLGDKGPACFLLETGDARLMLDLGYGPQPGLWPDVERTGDVDALLLSHGHGDHAGGLRLLPKIGDPPVLATETVQRMLPAGTASGALPLKGETEVCGVRIRTGRTGHAPGGVWLHFAVSGGLLYMSDHCVESLLYVYDEPPPAALVILDASYHVDETPLSERLAEFEPLFDAARVLLPIPPGGRGPEIAYHLLRSGRPLPCIDEPMRKSLERLATIDRASVRPDALADLARLAAQAPPIAGPQGVILAAAADAASGEAARLVALWEHETEPQIVFTGYVPPGTPAERLVASGRGRRLRWNIHPRLSDNVALARATRAEIVLPAFSAAAPHLDAWRAAFAPAQVVVAGPVEF